MLKSFGPKLFLFSAETETWPLPVVSAETETWPIPVVSAETVPET